MRLGRTAAAAAVGVAVLTGCSDGGTANETLPPVTSSAAPAKEALQPLGPADFPMPREAREATSAGAEAFTNYYLDLVNRTNTSMDPQYLRQFSRGCTACERLASEVDADAANQYHYIGGEITLTGDLQAALTAPTRAESAFLVNQSALQVVDQTNQPVPDLSFPALDDLSSGAITEWDSQAQSWIVTELTLG